MLLSVLVGGCAACSAVAAGWGPLAGLLVYSATGSLALIVSAILAAVLADLRERARQAVARRPEDASHALAPLRARIG